MKPPEAPQYQPSVPRGAHRHSTGEPLPRWSECPGFPLDLASFPLLNRLSGDHVDHAEPVVLGLGEHRVNGRLMLEATEPNMIWDVWVVEYG